MLTSPPASPRTEALRHEHATAMGGFLKKRSDQGFVKNWKNRWVMLVGSLLHYFENDDSKNPQGEGCCVCACLPFLGEWTHHPPLPFTGIVLLDGATVQLAKQTKLRGMPECVVIRTKTQRCFYFQGSSGENARWFDAIKAVPGVTAAASGDKDIAADVPDA